MGSYIHFQVYVTILEQTRKERSLGIWHEKKVVYNCIEFQITAVNLVLQLIDYSTVRISRFAILHLSCVLIRKDEVFDY